MIKDPVCGKKINRGKAFAVVEYERTQYFLCCPICQAQFEQDPKQFAKPEVGVPIKKKSRR